MLGYVVAVVAFGVVGIVLTVSACCAMRSTPKPEKLYGMVGESENAQRSGNAGMRPETHTGDPTPRPVSGALLAPGAE